MSAWEYSSPGMAGVVRRVERPGGGRSRDCPRREREVVRGPAQRDNPPLRTGAYDVVAVKGGGEGTGGGGGEDTPSGGGEGMECNTLRAKER